jgi:hypothetical protein
MHFDRVWRHEARPSVPHLDTIALHLIGNESLVCGDDSLHATVQACYLNVFRHVHFEHVAALATKRAESEGGLA